jgi:hypothetical protein
VVSYSLAAVLGGLGLLMLYWRPGPNMWIGVRTPWSLADREIWDKSWNHSAVLLLAMAAGALTYWLLFGIAWAALILWAIGYPIYAYRRKYGTLRFWKDLGWVDYRPVVRCRHCGHYQKLRSAAEQPVAICEACGHLCRSQ